MPDAAGEVRLAAARQAEGEKVLPALDEAALAQRGERLLDLGWEAGPVDRRKCLLAGQLGVLLIALDAPPAALFDLELGQVVEVAPERPPLRLGAFADLLGVPREGGELQGAHEERQQLGARGLLDGGGHAPTPWSRTS